MQSRYSKNLKEFISEREKKKELARKDILNIMRKICFEAHRSFPSLSRVVLTGSIIGGGFSETSDIDVLVAGLDKKDYFKLLKFLETGVNRHVDLILDEDLSQTDKKHILKNMEVVYESGKN